MAAVKGGEVGVEVIILLFGSLAVVVIEAKDHTIGYALKAGADTLKEEVSALFRTVFLGEVKSVEYRYIEPDKERIKLIRDRFNTSKTVPKMVDLTILQLKNLPKDSILYYPVNVPELKDIIMQAKGGGKDKGKEKTKEKTKEDTKNKVEIPKNVQRQVKKLSPEAQKGFEKAIEGLKNGDMRGLNNHPLKGDRGGQWAVDIKGTGQNRGGGRIIYEIENGLIKIIEIITGHTY